MEQAIQKIAFQWITALIWTVVVDTATRMSWLQETDIDFANRSRDWLSLGRPLWAGPARWFPIEACLRPKRLRLLDCMSGPWPLLSGQTFSDGVALVARLARAVKRWLGSGAVYRRIDGAIGD